MIPSFRKKANSLISYSLEFTKCLRAKKLKEKENCSNCMKNYEYIFICCVLWSNAVED